MADDSLPAAAYSLGPAQYCNWATVVFSSADFVVQFGQQGPADDGTEVVYGIGRLVFAPQHAKAFSDSLREHLEAFEAKHGPIPPLRKEGAE